jgi:O-Antigen ligase
MEHRDPPVPSAAVSSVSTASAGAPGAGTTATPRASGTTAAHRPSADAVIAVALAAALVALAFISNNGVDSEVASAGNTWSEIVVTVLGAVAVATLMVTGPRGRRWGMATVALMALLTGLGALSIVWSDLPDASWLASGQAVSYLSAFAGAVCLVQLAPRRWTALLGAVAIAMTALCGWSLLAKVFPSTLASGNTSGRLQAPFGYWNAIGVCAAIGIPAVLWAGARRDRGRLVAGLAAPAVCPMVGVLALSYSRSADAAAALAIALWLALAPVRLRSIVMLAIGAVGGAVISVWMLHHEALKGDSIPLPAQDHAGHTFGIVILVVLLVVAAAGFMAARAMDRVFVPEAVRRRIGWALIALLGLGVILAIVAVAASSRGLTGQISHGWQQLTSPSASVSTTAGRVLQFGSSRPLYWQQALHVGDHNLFKGVGLLGFGVARLRYTSSSYVISEAHGYLFEVYGDLGLLGIAVTFGLLVSWLVAAVRPLALRVRSAALDGSVAAEREGMIALFAIVVAFGLQSTLDWTWFFAGVAVPVLLCAGWLAGRGPLAVVAAGRSAGADAPVGNGAERAAAPGRAGILDRLAARPLTAAGLVALLVCTLAICWLTWRPLHSAQQLTASESDHTTAQAFPKARAAISSDPLALLPRTWLSQLYLRIGDVAQARDELVHATTIQPRNPATWLALAHFDQSHHHPRLAVTEYQRVLELDRSTDLTAVSATAGLQAVQRVAASSGGT